MSNTAHTATASTPMSIEEYIAFEERAEVRHEFINGNLIPMPGTTLIHNLICTNIMMMLRILFKKTGLSSHYVFQENVKVQIASERDYTYPDVVVTSDPRDIKSRYILKHPAVIFEVLSKTSRTEDSSDKFIRYKNIESLQNYILVDSEKKVVEVRVKGTNGAWEAASFVEADVRFPVPALGVELAFEDVYEGVLQG